MADLKVGTTVGGSPVWHQGNLALVPSGNAILYKGARIYSENDKPSANELQVVSRAGDTMTGMLNVETSTDYQLALKSSVSGSAYIRFLKGNTLQSYIGTDAAGDFKVAMTDANGSWTFDGLKIAKSNGDVSLKGALVSTNAGNFDIKYGNVQFIRANSSKHLYIGAPGGTDLILGYAQDGMTTAKIRIDSAVYNKTGGLLISSTGLIQRSAMDNPYYNQTESDARFIRLNVNTATNGYLLSKSSDMGTPHNLSMGYSGFFRHNGLGGFRGLTINVSHPDQSNGAHARGITFDYGSTGYGMYTYAYDGSGTRLANQKIYTEADKPTPAEIGALAAGANAVSASKLQTARTISLTGGATGSVSFDGSANASLAVTVTNDSHTHSDYVKKIGDTMSGNLTVPKVLLSAAQGAEANSVARRDFVESTVTAAGKGVKDLTITLPAGAPSSGYIPVLFKTYGTSNSFVFIDTLSSSGQHPMNNCSFLGNVRAGGWGDGGSYACGRFTIYSTSERAIHSIHGPAEAVDGFVVYVETRAFPIRVRVDIETAVTAHATDVSYGTSIFAVNGQVSGNTKTLLLANFDKGTGTYNGSNRVYDNGYNPTPEAVGALPANGNAVTASRLQTARLIAGVPFDGTSNISISATNVGALPASGNTVASIIDNTTNIGKTVLDYQTITTWAHPVGTSLFVTPSSANKPGGEGGYWNTVGRRDSNGGYAGIFVEYANSKTGVWIGKNETGTGAPIWQRVYTDNYKPTAVDVGALPITGGTLTGNLTVPLVSVTGPTISMSSSGWDSELPIAGFRRTHGGIGNAVFTGLSFGWQGNTAYGANMAFRNNSMKIRTKENDVWGVWNDVYHTGNKPTPSDIGATPSGYGIGEAAALKPDANALPNVGGIFAASGAGSLNYANQYSPIIQAFRPGGPDASGQVLQIQELDGSIAVRNRNGGNWTSWNKLYGERNRPTPGDVGAVAKAGDTMTGRLAITGRNSAGSFSVKRLGATQFANYGQSGDSGGEVIIGVGPTAEDFVAYLKVGVDKLTFQNGLSTEKKVYHEGFKPTPGDVGAVAKTGDTMSGSLVINKSDWAILLNPPTGTASYILGQQGGVASWYIGKGSSSSNDITLNSFAHSTSISLASDRIDVNKNIVTSVAQSTLANALTRKDYVDTEVRSKMGNAGDQVLAGNLTISSIAPMITLQETDTTKRFLLVADGYEARFQSDNTNGTIAWIVNANGVITLNSPHTSADQGTNPSSLTRKDYVDGRIATRAPTTHNHTAAQANSNIISGEQYAVGSYILAQKLTTSANGYGDNVLGSSLIPASAGNRYWDGHPLPGTWKLLGYAGDTGMEVDQRTSLFIRIS